MIYYCSTIIIITLLFFIAKDDFLVLSGYLAFATLIVSLAISPLRKLGAKVDIKLRKRIGVSSGIIALFHSVYSISTVFNFEWKVIYDSSQGYTGLIALSIYVFLLITSLKYVQRFLKTPSWKKLHRIVYFLPIIILVHSYYSANYFITYNILFFAIFILLMLLRIIPKKKKISPQTN